MTSYARGRLYRRGRIWWIQYYVRGKKHRESSDSETKLVATRLLERRLVEAQTRAVQTTHPTFELAATAIRQDYKLNGRRSSPEKRLSKLTPAFGGMDLSHVGTSRIRAYAAYRVKEGAAPATVNREMSCLRRMMNLMHQDGILAAVPSFPMLAERNIRTGFVGEAELQAILQYLRMPVRPVVEFAYITGWRKAEILSRDWRHVSDRSVRLDPLEPKNDEGREFPLIPRLRSVIDGQRKRAARLGGPVFFWSNGRRIKSFKDSWSSAVDSAGLPGLLFHDLRRSAVRNLVLAGIDRHTAMRLTGHKTASVFERYDIIDAGRLHQQAEKLQALYAAHEPEIHAIEQAQNRHSAET